MACFLVPMGEAIVTTVIQKVLEKKENKKSDEQKFTWIQRLRLLNRLLWGGVILLAIEHIWHGEITFIPPFLTAMKTPEDTNIMLSELSTVGVTMSIAVTFVWAVIVAIAEKVSKFKEILVQFTY
ncbi:MAG: hypothetical protein N3E50_03240 [Candidatus Goldbacteria bacterium]|nr:hypothetical protein [Candidatus Goldiibacteriota bacterium]